MRQEKLNDISKNKVSRTFAQIIDEIGMENAKKIARIAGGDNLYIPMVATIERPLVINKIREEFTGYNFRELASKYNKSVSTIRYICKDIIKEKRKQPMNGQINLFGN
ncbi:MAG: DNA-binding protein [Firmicutes bacterium]|nr:DNA-binding protein [Bacillota bacterium]